MNSVQDETIKEGVIVTMKSGSRYANEFAAGTVGIVLEFRGNGRGQEGLTIVKTTMSKINSFGKKKNWFASSIPDRPLDEITGKLVVIANQKEVSSMKFIVIPDLFKKIQGQYNNLSRAAIARNIPGQAGRTWVAGERPWIHHAVQQHTGGKTQKHTKHLITIKQEAYDLYIKDKAAYDESQKRKKMMSNKTDPNVEKSDD